MIPQLNIQSRLASKYPEVTPITALWFQHEKTRQQKKKTRRKVKSARKKTKKAHIKMQDWKDKAVAMQADYEAYRHEQLHRDCDGYVTLIPKNGGINQWKL